MFENIAKQIVDMYLPQKILLFGSHAKGNAKPNSDIDLCVVADTSNKRKTLADMYYYIDSELPIDILLYTPKEWEDCVHDFASFAHKINKEGVLLYG